MAGLGLSTTLGRRGRVDAEVGGHLQAEVEQYEAYQEDLPGGPGLVANDGVLTVPLGSHLVLLVHVLGQLEVEERDLVVGEVTRQLDVDRLAAVGD